MDKPTRNSDIQQAFETLIFPIPGAVCVARSARLNLMQLPTESEINPIPENLDGQYAVRHFLGKTLEQAEALFREDSLTYQEDLMFMGAPAFRFYVAAAINYIRSEAVADDPSIISCFAAVLESRFEYEAGEVVAVAPLLASACRHIVDDYERFDVTPAIYGDLRPRYESLEQALLRLRG